MKTGALILAGGRSSRMGGIQKGEIPWGNTTFTGLLASRLWQFEEKLISVRKEQDPALPGWLAVEDEQADRGPLGGIVSGLHAFRGDALFVVSCDMPFLPQNLPERLLSAMERTSCDVCICRDLEGREYPLCAVYSKTALSALENSLNSGRLRVLDALKGLRVEAVPAGRPLLNLNTPEQLEAFKNSIYRLDLEQAVERILQAVPGPAGKETLPLSQCFGRFLAEDFTAPMDNPPFHRSALDGYAVRSGDIQNASPDSPVRLRVTGARYAGQDLASEPPSSAAVKPGCALRIMTGAVMPDGADCVIRQEDTDMGAGTVSIFQPVPSGKNFARRGEDIRQGTLLLRAGQKISFAEAGILASMGAAQVSVFSRPRVALLSTGDELALPGEPLDPSGSGFSGKIYNSSLYLLAARLRELGAEPVMIQMLRDDPAAAALKIREIADKGLADLIITTGGVSVGEKDIFHQVVPMSGGELIFWRLQIKPGSPVMLWKMGNLPVLSLSGNPFAAFVTFELLARPALGRLAGTSALDLQPASAILASPFPKAGGLRRFVRGKYENGAVFLPEGHSSGMLLSLSGCNCLVDVPAGSGPLKAGDPVQILLER